MFASALILIVSLVLFAYWFRYTCILLLNARSQEDYAPRVAAANGLSFLDVYENLRSAQNGLALDALHRSLDRDYRVLCYLLQHASGLKIGLAERRLLLCDYAVMRLWYRVVRRFSCPRARLALEECSQILAYLAHQMGRRAAAQMA